MFVRTKIAFLILAALTLVASGEKHYFTAAVFEHRYRHQGLTAPRDIIESNLKFYKKAAKLAAKKGADIIVFNEFGIHPYLHNSTSHLQFAENVPDPRTTLYIPCNAGVPIILSTLSCMARENNIYIVADLMDKQPCDGSCDKDVKECDPKCPEDGVFMYNAAVAFNREGRLLARYRKLQQYFELLNTPDPEYVTFDTEFGRFGLFICFDSVFNSSRNLVRDYKVDTVAFPTFWFDDALSFNSVEWQQSWAIANRVNFLAANTHVPGKGSLGSGIYSKDLGALAYTFEPDGESKLLVAKVPMPRSEAGTDFSPEATVTVIQEHTTYLKEETGDAFPETGLEAVAGPPLDLHKDYRVQVSQMEYYTLARLEKAEDSIGTCKNGFCCMLEYATESDVSTVSEEYYLGAFSGLNNSTGYYLWCEETCLLLRCDTVGDKPCRQQLSTAQTIFKRLKLSADFKSQIVYPTVTLNRLRLAPKSEWDFHQEGSKGILEYESESGVPLLKAGMLGRCYDKDPPFVPFYTSDVGKDAKLKKK